MKILTICTAAYNAERHVEKMLNSLLASKYKELLEIIVVNDGSTDQTGKIVAQYVERNPSIVLLEEKENGGAGSARNVAFRMATGKYIKLIDADDWVDTLQFDIFIETILKMDVDVIWNDYYTFLIKKNRMKKKSFIKSMIPLKIYSFEDSNFPIPFVLSMHGITYKTSVIQENKIKLSEGISYTDFEYVIFPLLYIKTAAYVSAPFYVYQIGIEGQSISHKIMIKTRELRKRRALEMVELYNQESNKMSDVCKKIMQIMVASCFASYLYVCFFQEELVSRNQIIEIDRKLKELDGEIWHLASKVSKTVKMIRKYDYLGYYPMLLLRVVNRL